MFAPRLTAIAFVFLAAGVAAADSGPELVSVFPPGGKAGDTVEVTVTGTGLEGNEQLLFSAKGFAAVPQGTAAVDPAAATGRGKGRQGGMKAQAAVKFKVTVPKDAPQGLHDVRVAGKTGLSNPRAFAVGNMTEVAEAEPNNDIGQAQRIELNTTVSGVISTPTDVDFVIVKAKAGQSIVVSCLTSTIDSKLTADVLASTLDGNVLAANHAYRGGDALLDFQAPADGDYLVRVASFAYATGGSDHFYRLTVAAEPWVDAVFPPLAGEPHQLFGRNLMGGKPDPRFTRADGRPFEVLAEPAGDKQSLGLCSRVSLPPDAGGLDIRDDPRHSGNLLLSRQPGDIPCILDNDDNGTADKSQAMKLPCDIAGRIGRKNDRHWYRFEAKKGEVWTLEVFAERLGSPITPFFVITYDKGKSIVRMEDTPDPLSNNQFYCKSDDPGRYRFVAPADGTYRVMVSSVEAPSQWGVRDQYVLRIARERPDFRLVVMPFTPHLTDAGTVARRGAVPFSVFVFRFDGFNEPIALSARNLPPGVTCPPQTIASGQNRGTLVLTADGSAKDWEGFIVIEGKAGELKHEARPFSLTWSALGIQPNQPPPNVPMLARMDRGSGLALAVRGDAPFTLTPVQKELKARPGEKLELVLKVTRNDAFKDAIQVYSAVPNFGPRQQGNNPLPPLVTIPVDKKEGEVKVSIDVQQNTPAGTYALVLRGQSGAAAPKTATLRPAPGYPTVPVTVVIEGRRR